MPTKVLPLTNSTIDHGIKTVPTPNTGSISTKDIITAIKKLFFTPKIKNPEKSCTHEINKRIGIFRKIIDYFIRADAHRREVQEKLAYAEAIRASVGSERYPLIDGKTTYYVCENNTCYPPMNML